MHAPNRPQRILILGGGTAGWIAANLFAKHWPGVAVSVLESSEIGIIGVGEGSTPQLKAFFDTIGLAEADWMPACHATYKTGIRFNDWSRRPGFESYFHPFPAQVDEHTLPAFYYHCHVRRHGIDLPAHPDRYFLNAALAERRLAPLPAHHFPFLVAYGYHFDSALLGVRLRQHAQGLGVRHLEGKVVRVERAESGAVQALHTEDGRRLEADLYIDCSGFRALIHQEALGVPFVSFKRNLYNDAAVVMPTPPDADGLRCQTDSTALKHGWAWKIPLTHRNGNGYVYSTDHCSADAAETELRTRLGLLESDIAARHLKMRVGRVEQTWAHNSVAIGLSQGFIEPLEATAIHLVLETVERLIRACDAPGDLAPRRQRFNEDIARRIEGIRDYIVCHYRVNQREDTEYWRANAANEALSDSLRQLLECWFHGENLHQEIQRQGIASAYPSMSWHCLLAGYGTFPDELVPASADQQRYDTAVIDDFIARCALNFPSSVR